MSNVYRSTGLFLTRPPELHSALDFEILADRWSRHETGESQDDYRAQLGRPCEHAKLKELSKRQEELNKSLDLDKSERQVVEDDQTDEVEKEQTWQERVDESEPAPIMVVN